MQPILTAALLAICAAAPSARAQAVAVDARLPAYAAVEGVSGTIKSAGSDTMINLMALWCSGFREFYPNVGQEVEGKGSSSAPPALVEGKANFGPMSRQMKAKELDDFERVHKYKPVELPTAIDMLAVYVHKDNPIRGLTLQQVDAIFSKTRKGGAAKDIRTWGDVGLTGDWANKPIGLNGRNEASGTYGYFKEVALFGGDYKDEVKSSAGSSQVVQGVATDRYAIGYSGIGYKTADIRAVPLAVEGTAFIAAEPEHAYSGEYPLSRYLYLYVNYRPGSKLDPLRREFIRFVFSKQGQERVVQDGYFPVTAEVAVSAMKRVEMDVSAIEAALKR